MKQNRYSQLVIAMCLSFVAVLSSSCATKGSKDKATAPPHAFIRYQAPPPGFSGIRLAVKDNIDVQGRVSTAGSQYFFLNGQPATKDAPCLNIIRGRDDVFIVGKANLSEFAIGVTGSNDYFGTPVNPLDPGRIPGGSSSGSAVAVARGLADVALGTDTAGSVRVPAACCGVVGLKTTKGLIPIDGIHPISPNYLDTVGPLARDISGVVTGMSLLKRGFLQEYERARAAQPTPDKVKIARLYVPGTDPNIDKAIDDVLISQGFELYGLSDEFVREWEQAIKDGNQVAAAAAWYNDQHLLGKHGVSFRAKETIWFGDLVFNSDYKNEEMRAQAIARRDAFRSFLNLRLAKADAIAMPVIKSVPLKKGALKGLFEARWMARQNTVAVNYAGNPALAVPIPLRNSSFPVTSMQLVGPMNGEAKLLNIGRMVEAAEPTGKIEFSPFNILNVFGD